MPQMSPFNWLIMNLYFTNLMILLMIIIYYLKNFTSTQMTLSSSSMYKFKW